MARVALLSAEERRAFGTYERLAAILDGPLIKLIAAEKAPQLSNPMLADLLELDMR